jgi:ABC-2 type transport system ATP-binding protein
LILEKSHVLGNDADYVIETHDLVKIYKIGNIVAVNKLNLKIRKGEIYAFIGANGSGKTTAINMITGVMSPTSGSVRVLGLEMPKHRHQVTNFIGVAPQEYSVYEDLTVVENVKFFSRLYGVSKTQFVNKLIELLGILGLYEKRKTLVHNLSGGMKRRVSIACALVHEPKIVFFDEATVGIDPVLRQYFWDYFKALKEKGKTLVITSHVMDEAEKADRIGLIRQGRLVDEGRPNSLKSKYGVNTIEQVFLKLSEGTLTSA